MSPEAIAGKTWVAKVEAPLDARQRPRLEFQADGRLAGYTGCNTLGGSWRIAGDAVQVSALAMTKRACIGAGNDLEKRFLAAVNDKARIVMEGAELVASGTQGERVVFEVSRP